MCSEPDNLGAALIANFLIKYGAVDKNKQPLTSTKAIDKVQERRVGANIIR